MFSARCDICTNVVDDDGAQDPTPFNDWNVLFHFKIQTQPGQQAQMRRITKQYCDDCRLALIANDFEALAKRVPQPEPVGAGRATGDGDTP